MKSFNPLLSALFLFATALFISCEDEEPVVADTNKLVASAGVDQTMKVNETVELDGSASRDGNEKPFQFSWTVKTKPVGSVATLSSPLSAVTQFTADKAGSYTVQLALMQGEFTATDLVTIVVTAVVPDNPEPHAVILDENIDEATTLNDIFTDPDEPDYVVAANIEVRADLTISPGVVIAFLQNQSIEIMSGSIQAIGTPEKPIEFRGLTETPSIWKGILIHSNSDLNEFRYATIRHGGSAAFTESGVRANVALAGSEFSGGALKISHTTLAESGGYGLYLKGRSSLNEFSDNTFSSNAASAFIPAAELHKLNLSGTTIDVIETGGDVARGSYTWKAITGGYYLVGTPVDIKGGLTVEAGTLIRSKSGITISVSDNGYLKSTGTETSRVVFTSADENTYWNGLYINSANSNNILEHTEVSRGGLNKVGDAAHAANITIGSNGLLHIAQSLIQNGLGYGVVAKSRDHVNIDVVEVNEFFNFVKGYVYPSSLYYPDLPAITGEWVDYWTFNQNYSSITDNFYNVETGTWFGGADAPWAMGTGKGFGIRFDANGNFTWLIAEQSPMTGCESWSAEYITGTASYNSEKILFHQEYWRSKFVNKCDETQNVDTGVETFDLELPYEINRMYNTWTGDSYWELKFINPDNSTFAFYRR